MDLFFNIIFYGILALIPISLIFILALDKKSKLRNELIDNAKKTQLTHVCVSTDKDGFIEDINPNIRSSARIYDPAYSYLPENIHNGSHANDIIKNPTYSYLPCNIFHNKFDHKF